MTKNGFCDAFNIHRRSSRISALFAVVDYILSLFRTGWILARPSQTMYQQERLPHHWHRGNGNNLSQWRRVHFDRYRIKTPETIADTDTVVDCGRETNLRTEFGANRSTMCFWANGWNITIIIIVIIIRSRSHTGAQLFPQSDAIVHDSVPVSADIKRVQVTVEDDARPSRLSRMARGSLPATRQPRNDRSQHSCVVQPDVWHGNVTQELWTSVTQDCRELFLICPSQYFGICDVSQVKRCASLLRQRIVTNWTFSWKQTA